MLNSLLCVLDECLFECVSVFECVRKLSLNFFHPHFACVLNSKRSDFDSESLSVCLYASMHVYKNVCLYAHTVFKAKRQHNAHKSLSISLLCSHSVLLETSK